MAAKWRNPYAVRKIESDAKVSPLKRSVAVHPEDFGAMLQKFRTGIHEMSAAFRSMEKTVDSLAQLYQAFEKIGGPEKLNRLLTEMIPAQSGKPSRRATDGASPVFSLDQLMNLLQQIDFNQINQILNSPLFREFLASGGEKGETAHGKNQEK